MVAGQQQRGPCGGLSASGLLPQSEPLQQQQQAVMLQLARQLRCWAGSLCHLEAEEALFWASPLSA